MGETRIRSGAVARIVMKNSPECFATEIVEIATHLQNMQPPDFVDDFRRRRLVAAHRSDLQKLSIFLNGSWRKMRRPTLIKPQPAGRSAALALLEGEVRNPLELSPSEVFSV